MPKITLQNASLDFPVYDNVSRSLTRAITASIPIGGRIKRNKGERTSILALDDISISFRHGDRVALLGHNGAGKTTLLRMLAGFYEPTSGHIVREGKVSALLDLMAGMDINMSGYDNIILCGMLHGFKRRDIVKRMDDIAEFSELGSYLELPVRLYSQGMMLRLAFSICASVDSDILLFDEGVGAGDQSFLLKAKERLAELILRSSIVVLATHNPEVAKQLCNKAIFLEHGKLLLHGEIEEVLAFQSTRLAG